eukprot:2610346-Pyramimonas_sp.AAC.1
MGSTRRNTKAEYTTPKTASRPRRRRGCKCAVPLQKLLEEVLEPGYAPPMVNETFAARVVGLINIQRPTNAGGGEDEAARK